MHNRKISVTQISAVVILLCAVVTARAQTKETPAPPTGSISGHVLINNKAAAGIEVGAFGGESFNRRVATAQTKTDSEGYYHLAGLPAANYQVTTFLPNMIAAENTSQMPLGYGYFGSSKTVILAAGEEVTEIDLKLERGGVITGRVTDADDKPVVEERVSLVAVPESGQPPPRLPSPSLGSLYQTDDRGIYRIYGLPPGRYRVSVGQSAFGVITSAAGSYVLTYHPDATNINRATVIDLQAGAEVSNVDIKVGRRIEGHQISGRIVDAENGLPISGLRVGLQMLREQGMGSAFPSGVTTGADGSFTLSGVTSGRYGVYVASEINESEFYSDPVLVDVVNEDVRGIEVKALRGTTISGTIGPENIDLKELLRQVPALRVSASTTPDGTVTPTTIRSYGSGMVAADGSFTITGLRPGRVLLTVDSRSGGARPSLTKITVGGIGVTQGFEIERQPVSGIQLVVAYGTGAIHGGVTFQGGVVTDYRTEVICRREGARNSSGGAYLDARGHFNMNNLPPGSYDCGVQFIMMAPTQGRPVVRPPQVPHQTISVSNGVETELNFLVDLTPKGVGP
jgi:hypothetical protein